jgi:hypothetical protein
VIAALYLLVLPPPRTGGLAVLWWAALIAFFILAALDTIRGRLRRGADSGDANPSQLMLLISFLVVVALVAVVLRAIRVIPGT